MERIPILRTLLRDVRQDLDKLRNVATTEPSPPLEVLKINL
jgi:hypothetical protein